MKQLDPKYQKVQYNLTDKDPHNCQKECFKLVCIHYFSYITLVLDGCFNEQDDIGSKVKAKPNDPCEIVSEVVQSQPIWETLDPSSSIGLCDHF